MLVSFGAVFRYSGVQVFRSGKVKGRPVLVEPEHPNTRTPEYLNT